MPTRAEFLGRLRAEVAKTRGLFVAAVSERPGDPGGAAATMRERARRDAPALLARFTAEAERVAVEVHRVATLIEAGEVVLKLAVEREVRRVATWSPPALGAAGALIPRLAQAGLEVVDGAPTEPATGMSEGLLAKLAAAEMGLTGVDLAIAETGTLVLASGPGKGRAVSLLPPVHVALFGPGQLVAGLEDAGVVLESWYAAPPTETGANVVFITGPSRTADIELTLTLGVHGPKEVHAVFVASL